MVENIIDFFRRVTKLEPTDSQKKLLEAIIDPSVKRIAICAGRQTGKTLTCAVAAVYLSVYRPNTRIILTSVQENWLYDHMTHIWDTNPDLGENFKKELESTGTVTLNKKNVILGRGAKHQIQMLGYETVMGSTVYVRKSTEKALRGVGGDIAFLDEVADMTRETITTVMGNISGDYCKLVFLSTPHKTGMFTEIVTKPDDLGFIVFHWSELDCKWHSKEEIELKEKTFLKQKYKFDVLGEVLTKEERAFFDIKMLEGKCVVDREPQRQGGERSTIEFGLDFGVNETTLVIVEKLGMAATNTIYTQQWDRGSSMEYVCEEIIKLKHIFKPNVFKADALPIEYRQYYQSKMPYQIKFINMRKEEVVTNSEGVEELNCVKDIAMGQLQRKVQEGTIKIPAKFVDLIIQMRRYRKGMFHGDDLVDALAMAVYVPIGGWKAGEEYGCISPARCWKPRDYRKRQYPWYPKHR
jgi:hypothetical protein